MNRRPLCAAAVLAALSGCGYVGPVLPPSPQVPTVVTDLSVVERGDKLVIQFTTPARTTDNLAIRKFSEIELRAGPEPKPFDLATWEKDSRPYPVPLPPENSADEARAVPVEETLPVQDWLGKRLTVMVRTAVKKGEHYSKWSNRADLDVVEPLSPPELAVRPTSAGYQLSWPAGAKALSYQILRRGPADKEPVAIGSTEDTEFTDKTAQWDTPYSYQVVARAATAESLPSAAVPVNSADVFPPSVPTELSVSPTNDSIEVSWNRSPEPDVAGYYVYRSEGSGPPEKQGGLLALPAYTDRNLQKGKTYRYTVSAVDRKGNESAQSSAVEIASPLQ